MTPLPGSTVQTLAPHQVAHGSTLITVNRYVANSVGTALMSVILTKQFNHSETISTANALAILRGNATKRGTAHNRRRFRANDSPPISRAV
jgi:general stress protein CsbA